DGELVGVVDEPVLGGARIRWVEDPGRRHRRIGPGRGSDADRRAADRQWLASGCRVLLTAIARRLRSRVVKARLAHQSILGRKPVGFCQVWTRIDVYAWPSARRTDDVDRTSITSAAAANGTR